MAIQNTFYLDVDIKRDNYVDEPKVTQNDAVTFVLRMTDDGVDYPLTGVSTYTLASLRPDGQSVLTVGTLTAPNEITFELGSTEVSVPGNVKAAIQMYDVDGRVSSIPFTYEVTKDIATGYIPSKDEQTLIELVLGKGPAILNAAQAATVTANDAAANANAKAALANAEAQEANSAGIYARDKGLLAEQKAALADASANEADTATYNAENATQEAQDATNAINAILPNVEGLENRGEYNNATTYVKNNLVERNGSSWQALQDTQGNSPPTLPTKSNAYWTLISQRGIDGMGAVSTVNGEGPDVNGNVSITIPDPDLSVVVKKGELLTNVKDYGAKGDSITDDTVAIRNAINDTPYGGTLYFPAGGYLVSGSGSEIFLITKLMNIFAESTTTGLVVKANVPNTTDVIRVNIPGEVRFVTIRDLIIVPESGTPARYGIHLDVTDPNNKLANMLISRVRIEQLGSKSIKLSNPIGDGFYCNQIEKSLLVGGIELERCGDSVLIHENTITGRGIGVDMSAVDGSIEQSISFNNITSTGGSIRIKSGDQLNILYNNIEQVSDFTGSSGAMIEVVGRTDASIIGTKIIGNSLNGNLPTIKPTHLIKVDYAEDTVIENNNLQKGSGESVYISENAKDTKLGPNRWGSAEIASSVVDLGIGTRNVWQAPIIVTGWQNAGAPANPVGFLKDNNGFVHFRGAIITTLNNPTVPTTLFTIPLGFRPSKEIWVVMYGLSTVGNFSAYVKITSQGAVILESGPSRLYDNISLENIMYFASEV